MSWLRTGGGEQMFRLVAMQSKAVALAGRSLAGFWQLQSQPGAIICDVLSVQ